MLFINTTLNTLDFQSVQLIPKADRVADIAGIISSVAQLNLENLKVTTKSLSLFILSYPDPGWQLLHPQRRAVLVPGDHRVRAPSPPT